MPQKETCVVDFIESLAAAAGPNTVPHHIMTHGRLYVSASLNVAEAQIVQSIQWQDRRPKECYRNAQLETITLPRVEGVTVRYAEGYVDRGTGFGIDHAWLSINGKVVDPSLRLEGDARVVGVIPEGWGYYGVEFEVELVHRAMGRGHWSPIIDDPENGWPQIPGRANVRKQLGMT